MITALPPAFAPNDIALHHSLIFQAWRCALGQSRIIYLSGPITTGLRWIDALKAGEANAQSDVIAANSQDLLAAAAALRTNATAIVIEPASLTVGGWSQTDYLTLWTELIERHAGEVRFLEGWAFSNGCAHEFERALRLGIPTLNLAGVPIVRESGLSALRRARDRLAGLLTRLPRLQCLHAAIDGVVRRLESAA